MRIVLRERKHLGRDVLGQPFGQVRCVDEEHLGDAGDLRGLVGRGLCPAAGDQHVDLAAAGERRSDGVERRALQGRVVVFGDDE